jgi:hypothetical protein
LAMRERDSIFVRLSHTQSIPENVCDYKRFTASRSRIRCLAEAAEAARFIPPVNDVGFHASRLRIRNRYCAYMHKQSVCMAVHYQTSSAIVLVAPD